MKEKIITHKEFIEGYRTGKLKALVNKRKAGNFVLSDFANKHNKPAHLFWSWGGIILAVPLPIILLFVNWIWSIISFIVGMLIISASRKSVCDFVLQNMLDDEVFWNYVLIHGGAVIRDDEYNVYLPKGLKP